MVWPEKLVQRDSAAFPDRRRTPRSQPSEGTRLARRAARLDLRLSRPKRRRKDDHDSMCSTLDERPCTERCLNPVSAFPHSAIDVGNSTAPPPLQRAPGGSGRDLARACLATRYGPTSAGLVSRL